MYLQWSHPTVVWLESGLQIGLSSGLEGQIVKMHKLSLFWSFFLIIFWFSFLPMCRFKKKHILKGKQRHILHEQILPFLSSTALSLLYLVCSWHLTNSPRKRSKVIKSTCFPFFWAYVLNASIYRCGVYEVNDINFNSRFVHSCVIWASVRPSVFFFFTFLLNRPTGPIQS